MSRSTGRISMDAVRKRWGYHRAADAYDRTGKPAHEKRAAPRIDDVVELRNQHIAV